MHFFSPALMCFVLSFVTHKIAAVAVVHNKSLIHTDWLVTLKNQNKFLNWHCRLILSHKKTFRNAFSTYTSLKQGQHGCVHLELFGNFTVEAECEIHLTLLISKKSNNEKAACLQRREQVLLRFPSQCQLAFPRFGLGN